MSTLNSSNQFSSTLKNKLMHIASVGTHSILCKILIVPWQWPEICHIHVLKQPVSFLFIGMNWLSNFTHHEIDASTHANLYLPSGSNWLDIQVWGLLHHYDVELYRCMGWWCINPYEKHKEHVWTKNINNIYHNIWHPSK